MRMSHKRHSAKKNLYLHNFVDINKDLDLDLRSTAADIEIKQDACGVIAIRDYSAISEIFCTEVLRRRKATSTPRVQSWLLQNYNKSKSKGLRS